MLLVLDQVGFVRIELFKQSFRRKWATFKFGVELNKRFGHTTICRGGQAGRNCRRISCVCLCVIADSLGLNKVRRVKGECEMEEAKGRTIAF